MIYTIHNVAGWQSGHAAACKTVYAGSIPASASIIIKHFFKFESIIVSVWYQ